MYMKLKLEGTESRYEVANCSMDLSSCGEPANFENCEVDRISMRVLVDPNAEKDPAKVIYEYAAQQRKRQPAQLKGQIEVYAEKKGAAIQRIDFDSAWIDSMQVQYIGGSKQFAVDLVILTGKLTISGLAFENETHSKHVADVTKGGGGKKA